MAKLLTELALIDYRMLSFTASLTAASALYLALHLLRPQHQHHWVRMYVCPLQNKKSILVQV